MITLDKIWFLERCDWIYQNRCKLQNRLCADFVVSGFVINAFASPYCSYKIDKITVGNLIKLWNTFSPYEMNTLIASPDVMAKLLSMPEFRDAPAGLNFHGNGTMITPLGAKLIKSTDLNKKLVALDKNYALEMVTAGGVQTDFDRLIDRQLERAAITQISGFAKIFADSAKVMNV